MPVPEYNGRALFMPVYLPATEHIGLKVVTVHPDNPARGLPFIHALVMVTDAATGQPVAVMDGEYLTALRTGAASGLATDLLARPDAKVAAIFGAGVQGRTQLEAVCAVRPIGRAYIFSRSRDHESPEGGRQGLEHLEHRGTEGGGDVDDQELECEAT